MPTDTRSDDLLPVLPVDSAGVALTPAFSFDSLLPKAGDMQLTTAEVEELIAFEKSLIILGPAGGAVLLCPGNQIDVPADQRCPYAAKCPLLRMQKAPQNKLCPIERTITEQRFSAWCQELGFEPDQLNETARSTISELVLFDLHEQRCVNILSAGEAARLTQVNITEAVNFTNNEGEQQTLPLTWERVIHINSERLVQIGEQRRILLRDAMLTPEMKWKIRKAEGKAKGTDIGSKQSLRGDKLRSMDPAFE
jgi:hypothetical protein